LPSTLAAEDLRKAVSAISEAVRTEKTVILGMGAHPIKVGLNPLIVGAIDRGLLSGIAMNGAGIVHDVEIALAAKTSEDVSAHLGSGEFGMARETSEFIHRAASKAYSQGGKGLGGAVGEALLSEGAPYADASILAAAARRGLPVTVHVAIGTDIIHMHPEMNGAVMGALSHFDFRLLCALVSTLRSGVFINLGSAVVIPEVFLKAVSVVRNLGFPLDGLTTVNMDFLRQYRPLVNVVQRPTRDGGAGISLTGHHEIMFPLLMAAVMEKIEGAEQGS
jgi:deoxyhypusine synthase